MAEGLPPSARERVVSVEHSRALAELLRGHGYDLTQWGVGPTKTVDSLWDEVASGETELVEAEGVLMRRTHVAAIDVVAQVGDTRYKLREDRQVFRNGSVRHRTLTTSIGEKGRPDEDSTEIVRRALAEELGIRGTATIMDKGTEVQTKNSQTYGGMPTQLHMRLAEAAIAEVDFNPDGYVEHQAEKSIYFVWDVDQAA